MVHGIKLYDDYPSALHKFVEQIYKIAATVKTTNQLDAFLLELSAANTLFNKLNEFYSLKCEDSDFEALNETAFKINFDYLIALLGKTKETRNEWDIAAARLDCLINFKKDPSNSLYLAAMLDVRDKLQGSVVGNHGDSDTVKFKLTRLYVSLKKLTKWQLDKNDPLTPKKDQPTQQVAQTIVEDFFKKCQALKLHSAYADLLEIQQEKILERLEHDKDKMSHHYTRELAATLNSVLTALTKADEYQQTTQKTTIAPAVIKHLQLENKNLHLVHAANEKAHIDYIISSLDNVAQPAIPLATLKPALDATSARLDSLIKFKRNPSSLINLSNVCEHVNKAVKYTHAQEQKNIFNKRITMISTALKVLSVGVEHLANVLNHVEGVHSFLPTIIKGLRRFSMVLNIASDKIAGIAPKSLEQVKYLRPMTNALELMRDKPNNIGFFNLDHSEVELSEVKKTPAEDLSNELLLDETLRSNRSRA